MKTSSSLRLRPDLIRMLGCAVAACLFVSGCQTPDQPAPIAGDQVFDEHISGRALVDAALAEAKADNKRVILLFGANWCPYCRQLHALLEDDPEVSAFVEQSFVVVPIDVGTSARNRNVSVIDRYGATVFTDGTPSVVIVDANGRRLAPTRDNPWSAKNRIEPARVLAFLQQTVR